MKFTFLLLLIPLLGALTGWLVIRLFLFFLFRPRQLFQLPGFKVQGVLPALKQRLAVKVTQYVSSQLKGAEWKNSLTSPANIETVIPQADEYMEKFLRIKLPAAIPMLGMFISDKIVQQLKEVFLDELRVLLPEILKKYLDELQENNAVENIIQSRLSAIDLVVLEKGLHAGLAKQWYRLQIAATAMGLIIGLLQLLVAMTA